MRMLAKLGLGSLLVSTLLSVSGCGYHNDKEKYYLVAVNIQLPYWQAAASGIRRGALHGKSDATGSSPAENPVHPTQLVATIYHALGINPHTMVLNHLNQPRELVQGDVVTGILQ